MIEEKHHRHHEHFNYREVMIDSVGNRRSVLTTQEGRVETGKPFALFGAMNLPAANEGSYSIRGECAQVKVRRGISRIHKLLIKMCLACS